MLIDTHCHIHEKDYPLKIKDVISRAREAGVMKMVCIGTNKESSELALEASKKFDGLYASMGVHPHYAKDGVETTLSLIKPDNKLIAIGEIGLDYFYKHSSRIEQIKAFEEQLSKAQELKLPVIFHVRDAYEDFWSIVDSFHDIRGVLHCFTDSAVNLEKGLNRGFYIGLNGISTFTKDESQKDMFRSVPIERILLETDAPFLTPTPLRGKVKVNEPAYIKQIAEYNVAIYQVPFDEFASVTTANASKLFNL